MTAPSHTTETIERELAALGEAPPSAEELAMLREVGELGQHEEVANVARLTELAEPLAFDDLSELETHRGWRNVEQRLAHSSGPEPREQPRPTPIGGGPRRWLYAAIGVAAAAAVLFVVIRPPKGPQDQQSAANTEVDAEAVAEVGEQARASLKLLDDGTTDSQRAEQLVAKYQAQLEEQGG